ncbi:MAG: tetratricopeptide repeat protein [Proteobacteria bacterium]|nr:tetratricopeptide repeat protein [Pseudomonadota bacterium]
MTQNNLKHITITGFFLLISFLFTQAGCAPKATVPHLQDKMEILEARVVALEKQELKTLADLRGEVAEYKREINEKLNNFRKAQQFFIDELDTIKNDLELATNDNEQTQRTLRRNASRINKLNKRMGDQVIALQELQKFFETSIDSAAEDKDKEQADFEVAFKSFKARRFKKADQQFKDFRKNHPKSDLADDSLYFIAYMAFLRGDYNTSSLRLFELLKQYPKSNKKYDAKWWLGVSLERSGDLNGALDLYKELMDLKPTNPLRIKAQFRLEELAPTE